MSAYRALAPLTSCALSATTTLICTPHAVLSQYASGWPSFRDAEVDWAHVRVLSDGEVVSVDGTHLGHNLPDDAGNRFCINLVSIAGRYLGRSSAQCSGSSPPSSPWSQRASAHPLAKTAPPLRADIAPATRSARQGGRARPTAARHDLPPVAVVAFGGEAAIVGHDYQGVASSIAEVMCERLGPRAFIVGDWMAASEGVVVLFIVEVEGDGTACDAARRWMRKLKRDPESLLGGALRQKTIGVLALARSVCAFSAASGGVDKFSGAARLQRELVRYGCGQLLPMGMAEVEMEEVDTSVLPWADAAAAAFEDLLARRIANLAPRDPPPRDSPSRDPPPRDPPLQADEQSEARPTRRGLPTNLGTRDATGVEQQAAPPAESGLSTSKAWFDRPIEAAYGPHFYATAVTVLAVCCAAASLALGARTRAPM